MKIIVRSPNWIGDCVMCLPAIRALKQTLNESEITIVTQRHLREIFIHIPEIAMIWSIPGGSGIRGVFNASRELRKLGADAGILFTNSFHSAFLFSLASVPAVIGYNKDLRGFLLDKKLPFPDNDRHHVYFYLDLIEAFTELPIKDTFPNSLVILKEEREAALCFLREAGVEIERPMLGVSPSAAYGTAKEWEPSSFSRLIARLGNEYPDLQILLLGSQKERQKMEAISSGHDVKCFNLAGKLSLRESIVTISLCRCFLGNDSGLLHIASGVDVPYVGIFGPTLPHKTAPFATRSRILYKKADCAPCKHRDCPIDHRCMNSVSVDEVFAAVVSFLTPE